MATVDSLPILFILLAGQTLYLAAIVFALATWKKHPRVSAVTASACALAFAASLLPLAYQLLAGLGIDRSTYLLLTNAASFFRLIALSLLLVAVFIDRGEPRRKPPMPDEDARLPVPPRDDPRIRPS
jgi:hypothetical protein